jgi:tetratricopeptide (TPR) repeat protein
LVFLPASSIPTRPLAYVINIAITVFLIVLQMPTYKQWVTDHGRPTRKETGVLIPLVVGVSTTVAIVLFVFLIAFAAAPLLPMNRAITHYSRGVEYGNHNQMDLAIREYTRAIALDPQLSQAYSNRGNTYLLLGNFDQAITDCDEAIALRPDDGVAYFTRGIAYSARGQANEALSDLTKAIELHTNEAQAYYYRSFVYVELGKQEAAVQDLHNALELNPYPELRRDIETALEELDS